MIRFDYILYIGITVVFLSCNRNSSTAPTSVDCINTVFEDPASVIMQYFAFSCSPYLRYYAKRELMDTSTFHYKALTIDNVVLADFSIKFKYPKDTTLYPIYRPKCLFRLFQSLEGRPLNTLEPLLHYIYQDSLFVQFLLSDQFIPLKGRVMVVPDYNLPRAERNEIEMQVWFTSKGFDKFFIRYGHRYNRY